MANRITYRYFETELDLNRQYQFWVDITQELEFAWKPTRSPTQYHQSGEFSPKSRVFAFDNGKLVGYMSFTAHGDFVSLGYPWVLPSYQHLRDKLWHMIFTHIEEQIQPSIIAQRFRSQWRTQIEYFLGKGFEVMKNNPIYGLHLPSQHQNNQNHAVEVIDKLDVEKYLTYLQSQGWTNEYLQQIKTYYETIDFDVELRCGDIRIGLAIRSDNGFAEIIAVPHYEYSADYVTVIEEAANYAFSANCSMLSLTFSEHKQAEWLKDLGFEHISDDVYVQMKLD